MSTSKLKRFMSIGASVLMAVSMGACGAKNDAGEEILPGYDESKRIEDVRNITPQEYTLYNLAGTDDFNRRIVTVDGKTDADRYVGMFFFLTLGQHENHNGIYDISKITQNGADDDAFQVNNNLSPLGSAHFWGEPVFGYYNSSDEWVIRKQMEMLTLAGVDFLVFDCTNAFTYDKNTSTIFKVLKEFQEQGWNVPKVMYYIAHNNAENQYLTTLTHVYNHFYKEDTYKSLWFCPDGKPLITMSQDFYYKPNYGLDLSNATQKAMYDLFEFKCRQWPTESFEENGVPWIEFDYPQESHNGWMNVSIAQHNGTVRFSDPIGTQGRGYDYELGINDHERYEEDLNYQSQWQTVLELEDKKDARFTFITGWNEWIASKMQDSSGEYFTVDTYNTEYSRDIEPSVNLGDNSYMLTCKKIKENNFSEAKHYKYPEVQIDIEKDDSEWDNVKAHYIDFINDCPDRNSIGFIGKRKYTDTSGRNDFSSVKVARNKEYLYLRITTAEDITAYQSGDDGWMNVWIKTASAKNLYQGYNYVLNREVNGNKTAIYKAVSKSKLEKTGEGDIRIYGKTMIIKVKLADVGMSADNYEFEFKLTDNIENMNDYLTLYKSGDCAPLGRLNYKFGY